MAVFKRAGYWHMDATVNGVRYREALHTSDKREAKALEKKRIADIQSGKGTSKSGREFARKPFSKAADAFLEERSTHVAPRTYQFETERLKPLKKYFGNKAVLRIKATDISRYQKARQLEVANRTINMEICVLRRMLKRAKTWAALVEDVKMLPEDTAEIAQVLTDEQKKHLFNVAASRSEWEPVYCAAVIAASTTCRGIELRTLRWKNVDLMKRIVYIRRSKTKAGCRDLPLNDDAMKAFARLWRRAEAHNATDPEHFVFPTCETGTYDPTKCQKSFRSAWRRITKKAGMAGFRFHDLRHQAITELAENGAPDATLMGVAGHLSREMLEHYSHVRMAAKRDALTGLSCGLMKDEEQPQSIADWTPAPDTNPQ